MIIGDKRLALSFGRCPSEDPEGYPGRLSEGSYLLLGDSVLSLTPGASIDGWLERADATPMERRSAVLAVGSNASPAQLMRKFAQVADLAIPVLRAWAVGVRPAFSAHINPAGYIPAAARLAVERSQRCRVWVTFLDDAQLAIMDLTEPSYDRVLLAHADGGPVVELDSGESLTACALYRTKRRVLDLEASGDDGALICQQALRQLITARCLAASGSAPALFASAELLRSPASVLMADLVEISGSGLIVDDALDELIVEGKPAPAEPPIRGQKVPYL